MKRVPKWGLGVSGIGLLVLLAGCQTTNTSLVLPDSALDKLVTAQGVEFVRTPDKYFANLPDWNYEAQYVEIDGLRQAYVDVGPRDADPILLLHGEPSWSYLYRFMIPELVKRGHRVIAMDHLGMGRADKPIDLNYYTFDVHLHRLKTFIDQLKLHRLTVFMQDWGSVIGMYLAASDFSVFDRIVLGNGGLPILTEANQMPKNLEQSNQQFDSMMSMLPPQQMSFFDAQGRSLLPINNGDKDAGGFGQWMAYARTYKEFQVSRMLEALTYRPLSAAEKAAYDAPFPARIAMAGPRSFPSLLNELLGRTDSKLEAMKSFTKPFLTIFGGNDPGLAGDNTQQWIQDNVPGAKEQAHYRYRDASHYLQEDQGQDLARRVDEFMKANPLP